jgi:hypothetical protein
MSNKIKFSVIVVLFSLFSCHQIYAQNSEAEILNTYIDKKNVNSNSFHKTIKNISLFYKIPIGVELSYEDTIKVQNVPSKQNVLRRSGSLKEILKQLVEAKKIYDWQYNAGIIYLFPKQRDSVLREIFALRFGDTKFQFSDERIEVGSFIFETPLIKSKLKSFGVTPVFLDDSSGLTYRTLDESEDTISKETLEIKNISVKELLDRLLREKKINYWYIGRWGQNREFISMATS